MADEDLLYVPEAFVAPTDASPEAMQDLVGYLERELLRISLTFEQGPARTVEFQNVAPARPREGMVTGADGTNWDPGYGQGIYGYWNSTWNPLGLSGVSATLLNLTDPGADRLLFWDDSAGTLAWNSTSAPLEASLAFLGGGSAYGVYWTDDAGTYAEGTDGAKLFKFTDGHLYYDTYDSGSHVFRTTGNATQFVISPTASAVDYHTFTGAATGANQVILWSATGSDSKISIGIAPKGGGGIKMGAASVGSNPTYQVQIQSATTSIATLGLQAYDSAGTYAASCNFISADGTAIGSITSYSSVANVLYYSHPNGHYFRTGGGTAGSGSTQFTVAHTASAVNYWQFTGSATSPLVCSAQGSGSNISIQFQPKGSAGVYILPSSDSHLYGGLQFYRSSGGSRGAVLQGSDDNTYVGNQAANNIRFFTNGDAAFAAQFLIAHTASTVNYVQVSGATTTNYPYIYSNGSDTNVGLNLFTKGSGPHRFYTAADSSAMLQVLVSHTASAVNYLRLTGGSTGSAPQIASVGADTNVALSYITQGNGAHNFYTNGNTLQHTITHTASAVNYWGFTGSATGSQIKMTAAGSDSSVGVWIKPKGSDTSGAANAFGNIATLQIYIPDDGCYRINVGDNSIRVCPWIVSYSAFTSNDNTRWGILGVQVNNVSCTIAGGTNWEHLTASDTAPASASAATDGNLAFQDDVSGAYVWIINRRGSAITLHITMLGYGNISTLPTATSIF